MRSSEKTILHATGKQGGKTHNWIVAVFNAPRDAKPFVATLKLHYKTADAEAVTAMDPKAPLGEKGELPTDVRFALSTAPYAPEVAGLDEDSLFG